MTRTPRKLITIGGLHCRTGLYSDLYISSDPRWSGHWTCDQCAQCSTLESLAGTGFASVWASGTGPRTPLPWNLALCTPIIGAHLLDEQATALVNGLGFLCLSLQALTEGVVRSANAEQANREG